MVDGYTGPLFTLRRADGATMDVQPQAGGDYPDYAAIDAWAGGDIPTVATMHDQSGNGRDLVQTDPARQPVFDTALLVNNACPIAFNDNAQYLELTGISIARQNFSIIYGEFAANTYNPKARYSFYNAGGVMLDAYTQNGKVAARLYGTGATFSNSGATSSAFGHKPWVRPMSFAYTNNGSQGAFYCLGVKRTANAGGAETLTSFRLGTTDAQYQDEEADTGFFGVVIYDTALPDADVAAAQGSMDTAFGFTDEAPEYILCHSGDSIMEGNSKTSIRNMPVLLEEQLGRPHITYNLGIGGIGLAANYSNRVSRFGDLYNPAIPCVMIQQAGTNDPMTNAGDGNALYNDVATPFIQWAQGIGWKVIRPTILPRTV